MMQRRKLAQLARSGDVDLRINLATWHFEIRFDGSELAGVISLHQFLRMISEGLKGRRKLNVSNQFSTR